MVLLTLFGLAVETSIWTIKTTYRVGRWMFYGSEKSDAEKIVESLRSERDLLHEDLVIISKRLEMLEERSESKTDNHQEDL